MPRVVKERVGRLAEEEFNLSLFFFPQFLSLFFSKGKFRLTGELQEYREFLCTFHSAFLYVNISHNFIAQVVPALAIFLSKALSLMHQALFTYPDLGVNHLVPR